MFELVNTSLPNGLIAGTHGFATVAMTRGLADNLRRRLEDLSAYVHKTSAHDSSYETLNPVAWSHLILPRGEHVLGRVAAAPFDYTGRTNRLARLLCIQPPETAPANAAEALLRESAYFSAPWEGEARWLEPDAALAARFGAPTARASRKSLTWIDAFGEVDGSRYAAGFAALLRDAIRQNGRPLTFVTSQQSEPDGRRSLAFIADLIALLPDDLRPNATFSTYPCAIPIGVKCAIRVLRKDDNGYAQAVAGVPVADFAAKTIHNANLLPCDAELEHLAATGSLSAPSAPTAQTKAAPQAAAPAPTAASASTDETIDVSIDIPPTTEAGEAIAVTAKDASHRKPSLKHRPGPSAPLAGQRFDPLFVQPRKRGKGPLIAAVAAGVALILCLVAVLVLQSKQQGSISGGDAAVQTAQDDEQEKIREREKADEEAQRKADEEKKKRQREQEEARKNENDSRVVVVHERTPAVGTNQSEEAKRPLYSDIRHVSICTNDTQVKEDPKTGFGPRNEKQLTAVSVWYYSGDEQHGYVLKECKLNAKTGSGGDWDDANPGFFTPDPKKGKLPPNTPYCRIWRFDSKPDTLYWVTGNANGAEFDVLPPHNDTPINLAERFAGPDLRVLAQWEKCFGKVSCQAWTAEGTNPADLIMVTDVSSFTRSDFIVQCFPKRKEALDKEYAEVQSRQARLKELQNETNTLAKAVLAFEKEVATLKTKYDEAEKASQKAKEEYAKITADITTLNGEMLDARAKKEKYEREKRGGSFDPQKKHDLDEKIKKWEKEEDSLKKNLEEQRKKGKEKEGEKTTRQQALGDANSKHQTKIRELKSKKDELAKLVAEVDSSLEAKRKVEAAQAAFPKSVEEAQKQWTIHVRVDLGGAKQ